MTKVLWMRPATRMRAVALGLLVLGLGVTWQTQAAPMFFVDATPPSSSSNDTAWQSAVGSWTEEDFEGFTNGQAVPFFTMGGVTVTVSLPNVGGPTTGRIFAGSFSGAAGGQAGTVDGKALLTCMALDLPCDIAIQFDFSAPVLGFGAWIFDDGFGTEDSFRMMANSATSAVLDANPGFGAHIVEGFIGVKDDAGISSLTIFNVNSQGAVFELDHLQLAELSPVPEPATLELIALGLLGLGWRIRRAGI